jgi:hypothetical protein
MNQIVKLVNLLYYPEDTLPDAKSSIEAVSQRLDILEKFLLRSDVDEINVSGSLTSVHLNGHSSLRRKQTSPACSLDGATIAMEDTKSEQSEEYIQKGAPTHPRMEPTNEANTGVFSLVEEYNTIDRRSRVQNTSAVGDQDHNLVARQLHVYGLTVALRGLPAGISAAEAADIRAALPPAVLDPQACAGRIPTKGGDEARPQPSLLHRISATLTYRLLMTLRGAGPRLASAVETLQLIDERLGGTRRGCAALRALAAWAGREGAAGRAVRWVVVGVAEGVVDGFGRGVGWGVEEDEDGEERGRRRKRRE